MKLRVKINKRTIRVVLDGEPTLTELNLHVKEILFPSYSLSPDTEFTLSLNGAEPLSDAGQTLSSCGIVSGDLICVILPQSVTAAAAAAEAAAEAAAVPSASPSPAPQAGSSSSTAAQRSAMQQSQAMHSKEPSASSSRAARVEAGPKQEEGAEEEQEAEAGPFIWEPMMCDEVEEGKVPLSLEVLHHGAQSRSPCDSLMVAVHLLMLETGFLPQGSEAGPGEMPSGWQAAGGMYKLQYVHPLCENSLVMVLAVTMGPMLVMNASLKMDENVSTVLKLSLKPCSYVTEDWAGESAAAVYKDLKKLSRIFKDQLVYPLIAAAREAMALPPVFGLVVLPPELLLRVLRLLDVHSVVALSSVSRDLHSATADSTLWRHLYRRDFRDGQIPSTPRDTNWKDLYKRKYKLRTEASIHRRMPHLNPFILPDPTCMRPVPVPLYPPGIIGGEYDQRPGLIHPILRPRYDPIGPLPGHDPLGNPLGGHVGRRGMRPAGNRPSDIRRGFI